MPLKFQIDAEGIAAQFKEFTLSVTEDIKKAVENLATLTRTRVVEEVSRELHTSQKDYMNALSDAEEIAPGVWVISLDEKALWIEEGIEPNKDMKPDLLKGRKYRVIPFRYDRSPNQNTPFTQGLISEIRQKLRKEKVPFKKIEYDANGSPRTGKLHEFNLGGPRPGKGNTPALTRLSIYQNEKAGKIKRDILTFRTVSSGPASAGKWIHPGLTPKKFMDKAMDMAVRDWEEKILPEILEKWGS
jgi:hypothetical protein